MVNTSPLIQTSSSGTCYYVPIFIHCFSVVSFVCSNGQLDPWSAGGVLKTLTNDLPAVLIPNAAHHLDLRARNYGDTREVERARQAEMQFIERLL